MKGLRVFIAVDISEQVRSFAEHRISELRKHAGDVRVGWERAEKLHVTVKFLGETHADVIDDISHAAAQAVGEYSPFELSVAGSGVVPSASRPRVLWFTIDDVEGTLRSIAGDLDERLASLGFQPETKTYTPHITLARVREPRKGKGLADRHLQGQVEPIRFTVEEIVVYESLLGPAGSTYRPISTHRLGS